ncbi:hypothetical protein APHAL10511_005552 [Amanita phalloides]|nr:hypothetical protein APHAL10511_005552 [Amanita phalloides]
MPYYGPLENGYTLFLEKTFLAADFVGGVGYGVQLVLYIKCARYLWSQRKIRGKISLFLLGYITVLLSLSSMFVSSGVWTTEDMYINNRNYPDGPWGYFLATQNLPEDILYMVSLFLLTYLSDLLVLWRCWVIWNSLGKLAAYVATVIPAAALLASFALGVLWTWSSDQKGVSVFDPTPMTFGTAYCVTSLCVNILLTILIILRLGLHRQRVLLSLPPEYAAQYVSLAAIIIESAALYSVFAVVYIITYAINSPMNLIFLPFTLTSQQIAGYLIILRVARGNAWSSNALSRVAASEPRLTALHFNAPVFSSHVDMNQEPIDIELGNPLSNSTLLTGSVSSSSNDVSSSIKLKTTFNNSGLHPHAEELVEPNTQTDVPPE